MKHIILFLLFLVVLSSFVSADTEPPNIHSSQAIDLGNNIFNITVSVTDNVSIDTVIVEIEEPSTTKTNYTMIGDYYYVYTADEVGEHKFTIYANDTSGNSGLYFYDYLRGYWKFDGNANDESINGNDGVVTGASVTDGYFGSAYEFDGENDYINLGNGSSLELEKNNFSISLWVKQKEITGSQYPISRIPESWDWWYIIEIVDGKPQFQLGSYNPSCSTNTPDSSVMSINEWHNIIALRNGTEHQIYVDGELVSEVTGSVCNLTFPADLIIGYGDIDNDWFFNGTIDEVMIVDKALTYSEMASLYRTFTSSDTTPPSIHYSQAIDLGNNIFNITVNVTDDFAVDTVIVEIEEPSTIKTNYTMSLDTLYYYVYTADEGGEHKFTIYANDSSNNMGLYFYDYLRGYWKLDGNANDESVNANDGIVTGASIVDGYFGSAYEFDGNSDYINMGGDNSLNLGYNNFSISLWINQKDSTGSQAPVSKLHSSWDWWYQVEISAGNVLLQIGSNSPSCYVNTPYTDDSNISSNEWYHIVVLRNGTEHEVYIDGELRNNKTGGVCNLTFSSNLTMGYQDVDIDQFFDGTMDEIIIVDKALTLSEISSLYRTFTSSDICDNVTCTDYDVCQPDVSGGLQDCIAVNETEECIYTGDYTEFQLSCDYCTPILDTNVFCAGWSGTCPTNYTEYCLDINNTCYDETGASSDIYGAVTRGCVGTYGSGEIVEVIMDNIVGIMIVIFSLISIIALALIFAWVVKKWKER